MTRPKHMLVTSPMRTGSTWLTDMLRDASGVTEVPFVSSVPAVRDAMRKTPAGAVLKTHAIIDLDWPDLPDDLPVIRLTRNYKDSLVSRVLYTTYIRPREGFPLSEAWLSNLLTELGDAPPEAFVEAFVTRSPLLEVWMSEIVAMERGESTRCRSVTYEGLCHNPYDALSDLIAWLRPDCQETQARVFSVVDKALGVGQQQRQSFLRARAVGVGGWENWLTPAQARSLDRLYFDLRERMARNPTMRLVSESAVTPLRSCKRGQARRLL